jgi:hypothetical protein
MNLPSIADHFKRNLISETATRLTAAHGRRKMYSAAEVQSAMQAAKFPAGWAAWGVAVFCTNAEFEDFCAAQGLSADYNQTRADALRFLDKPQPSSVANPATLGVAAGAATLTAGAALADSSGKKADNSGSGIGDAAAAVVDVVGGIVDVLGIFD